MMRIDAMRALFTYAIAILILTGGFYALVIYPFTLDDLVKGAIIGFMALGLLYVPQLATISATFPAMFPTAVRFAGFAMAYNISTSIFGGTAPIVGSGLISLTGDPLMPAYYMALACLVGLVALRFMPETAGRSLRENPFEPSPQSLADK